jgi:endonuclease/exonuclease/phosphatase family metal-dependent hydrolase
MSSSKTPTPLSRPDDRSGSSARSDPAGRRGRGIGMLASVAILSGCATSHGMMQERPGGWCPDRPAPVWGPEGADRGSGPSLNWISPLDEGDRRDHATWCEAVGPSVVELEPAPVYEETRNDPEPEEAELVVVAWNAWIGAGDVDAFMRDHLGVSCSENGPELRDGFAPFVLLLQEVHRRSSLVPDAAPGAPVPWLIEPPREPHMEMGIVEVARRCGLSIVYIPSARNGWEGEGPLSEDKGNAILSSLPLRQPTGIELPFEAGRKVAIGAYVELGTGADPLRVDLTSVHFDVASTLVRTVLTGNQTRHRQAGGLLEGMELAGLSDHALVAGGDFNTWSSRDGSLKRMSRALPDSPPLSPEGTRGPFPTDHLFFRSDPDGLLKIVPGSYERIEDTYGSDHNPRLFRLRVGPGRG